MSFRLGEEQQTFGLHRPMNLSKELALVGNLMHHGRLFEEAHRAMKPEGLLLFSEPRGHVKPQEFEKTVELARSKGFGVVKAVEIWRYHSVLMSKTV